MKKVLEKQRNSTIELLRILCILMIVFMHLVGIWWDYCDNLFDKEFVIFVNSLCNCAVTIFMLISGYYGIRFNLRKIVQFEMMVIFYSIGKICVSFVNFKILVLYSVRNYFFCISIYSSIS